MSEAYESTRLSIDRLVLDPKNPRLPEDLLGKPESAILEWLEATSNLEELASSMIQSGFFEHEPLIVRSPTEPNGSFVVVEGNRRFATILILLQKPSAIEAELEFEFDELPSRAQLDALRAIPCVVVSSDDQVRKFLGFRHIGGIKTWSAEAKARYLVIEVDAAVKSGSINPFKDVGKRVGTNALGVRGPYIALKSLHVAREQEGLGSLSRQVLRERFGVWNRLLNSSEVRTFIGLGESLDYQSVTKGLRELKFEHFGTVLRDLIPEAGAKIAVLQDSRDVTTYGRVIANTAAREALSEYRDLRIAAQIADGSSLPARIKQISSSIDLLMRTIDTFEIGAAEVEAVSNLFNTVRSLNVVVKDRHSDVD